MMFAAARNFCLKSHFDAIQFHQVRHIKMPKHKKHAGASTGEHKSTPNKPEVAGPVHLSGEGNIRITILAKPGAKHNTITDISLEGVSVQISAPPREGEANSELCKYLAGILGVRKTAVSLDKGSKSRNKVVQVSGSNLTVEAVTEKLKQEMDNG